MMHIDYWLTVWLVTNELAMTRYKVWKIPTGDLDLLKVCAKKWCQNCWKITRRIDACKCVRESSNVLKPNQTCYKWLLLVMSHRSSSKTWTKCQSFQWKILTLWRMKKPQELKSKAISMFTTFFDVKGIVYWVLTTGPLILNKFFIFVVAAPFPFIDGMWQNLNP